MTTDINSVEARRVMVRPQLMPPLGSRPACDSGQSDLPQALTDGGADPSQPAPLASREGIVARRTKRRARFSLPGSLLEARLNELFWREPNFDHLAEVERRIATVLEAALTPEPTQPFDDLYDRAACGTYHEQHIH